MSYVDAVRNKTREAVTFLRHPPYHLTLRPWEPLAGGPAGGRTGGPVGGPVGGRAGGGTGVRCTICRWRGRRFAGEPHAELSTCPRCRSIGRDRYLMHCLVARTPYRRDLRLLETSPRLGEAYRRAMKRRVSYLCSDYDARAHRADLSLDLQAITLPDASLDVVVTPHVLEHVPGTDAALSELYRVLRPGGRMFLQVPLGQAVTAPPPEPEFHDDDTPVFWRFGLDLTDRLRDHGFRATLLVTEDFYRRVDTRDGSWPEGVSAEWDAAALVEAAKLSDLTVVADDRVSRLAGFVPSYMYTTWEAVRPAAS